MQQFLESGHGVDADVLWNCRNATVGCTESACTSGGAPTARKTTQDAGFQHSVKGRATPSPLLSRKGSSNASTARWLLGTMEPLHTLSVVLYSQQRQRRGVRSPVLKYVQILQKHFLLLEGGYTNRDRTCNRKQIITQVIRSDTSLNPDGCIPGMAQEGSNLARDLQIKR